MAFSCFLKLHVNKRSPAGSGSLCALQGNILQKRKAQLKGQATKSIFPDCKIVNISLDSWAMPYQPGWPPLFLKANEKLLT